MTNNKQPVKVGDRVLYTLNEADAIMIARRRTTGGEIADRIKTGQWPKGAQAHIGNQVSEGLTFAGVVVATCGNHSDSPPVNIQVFLDGSDTYWATSRHEEDGTAEEVTWEPGKYVRQ